MPNPTKLKIKILSEAKRLLTEKGWIKGTYARNRLGDSCSEFGMDATCFCLLGALHRASHLEVCPVEPLKKVVNRVIQDTRNLDESIHEFNDAPATTLADVLSVLDEAIKREEIIDA